VRIALLVVCAAGCRAHFDEHSIDARSDASLLTYRETVIASAPIGYYRLGGATPVDDISGTTGTVMGGCTAGAPGAIANDSDAAFAFDGTCRITLAQDYDFPGTAPFAIEAWLSTSTDASFHLPFAREVRGPQNPIDGYALDIAPPGIELERVIDSAQVKCGPVAFTQNAYVHVVAQYSGVETQLFVDGAQVASAPDTRSASEVAANSLVGAASPGNFYVGSLDELAIYDHALGAEEVAQHYAIGIGN
jgi:hypothetical protein